MQKKDKVNCIICGGKKVYSHGTTSAGSRRLRCSDCGKTWAPGKSYHENKTSIAEVTEMYLKEYSLRELVKLYRGSPMRFNQKIREFLAGCPSWEQYLDSIVDSHHSKMIYLCEKTFSYHRNDANITPIAQGKRGQKSGNKMTLALAVDALSSVILGFQIGNESSEKLWTSLLTRLRSRGVSAPNFLAMGIQNIETSIKEIYPESELKINYHKTFHERQLNCCLNKNHLNTKLITDASNFFNEFANSRVLKALKLDDGQDIEKALYLRHDEFLRKIRYRIDNKSMLTIDGLMLDFDVRFGKFHMLRENPEPLINCWIAHKMLEKTDIGLSRISYYLQLPTDANFLDFACANYIAVDNSSLGISKTYDLLVELCVRGVELPLIAHKCQVNLDKCSIL